MFLLRDLVERTGRRKKGIELIVKRGRYEIWVCQDSVLTSRNPDPDPNQNVVESKIE